MRLHSTNRNTADEDFKTAILLGQALDKGLYMLNEIPKLDQENIYNFKNHRLNEIGYQVLSKILSGSIQEKLLIRL